MTTEAIFLQIADHFIHPSHPAPELSGLQPEELNALLQLGQLHALFPPVYEAVCAAPGFARFPQALRLNLKKQVLQQVAGQTRRTAGFLRTCQALQQKGLSPLVVKGIVLRQLYAQPDFRSSSDEDLLIPPGDFAALDQALTQLGYSRNGEADPRKDHEITFFRPSDGLHLEVHLSLFPESSGAYGRLNREFTDVFPHAVREEIQGVPICTMAPTQHMLYLLCHSLKHFLHSGFGLRQLCDMVLFAEARGSEIDWARVEAAARRQNMYLFWINLFDIGQRYLGFSREKAHLPAPRDVQPDSQALLQDLLSSGIYGKSSSQRLHSANITLQAAEKGTGRSFPLATLFPNLPYMRQKYPYLSRRPWLLPAAWMQRGFSYVRKAGKTGAAAALDTGAYRVSLLKKYGIIDEDNE